MSKASLRNERTIERITSTGMRYSLASSLMTRCSACDKVLMMDSIRHLLSSLETYQRLHSEIVVAGWLQVRTMRIVERYQHFGLRRVPHNQLSPNSLPMRYQSEDPRQVRA